MSARDDVLAAVAAATSGGAGEVGAIPRDYRRRLGPADLGVFVERVEDYRATVTRCRPEELAETVRRVLGSAGRVVVPDGLGVDVPGGERDTGLSSVELDRVDAVVTESSVAVAETGTIVLEHGPGQGRRALSLVPDHHVCIVRTDQVVEDVPAALERLDPLRPQTWISGPSATSDIELSRVEGVHGPRRLDVVLVETQG
ncbi:MAG TPA: LUD domain-containing protein [Dermatophilaceae bacterium]|nr:LUD domain-containing protein [Dermatophilaceae bacterium]